MPTINDECYWTEIARDCGSGAAPLRGTVEVDVAIIGAGIVGTVAARLLKDRGQRVALIEAGRAGHGVSGRSTAKVTAQHSVVLQRIERGYGGDTASAYAEANLAGVALIADLTRRHMLACDLEPADSWVYALTDDGARRLEEERAAGERAGLLMEIAHDTPLPYNVRAALRLVDQFQFQPVDFIAGLAATLPGDGSFVFEHSLATDWTQTRVSTAAGSIDAEGVVMATHLPLGQVGQFHAHTHPHMHAVMAVPVESDRAPAGMYISVDKPKRSLRSHRRENGDTMLILTGPTFKHGDAASAEDGFAELEAFAREHFGYAGAGYRWTNEDYEPRDGLPYMGWSGSAGNSLLVATGFDAWGLSNGAAAGLILADLCEERPNGWASCFDASRHSLHGLGKLAADTAKTTAALISGHVHAPAKVENGDEGSVVDIGGRTSGLYRDPFGQLCAISAVCTHMGCLLGWNPVDRTWDCSCHGSRFAADGHVLHGPAVEPLSPIEIRRRAQ